MDNVCEYFKCVIDYDLNCFLFILQLIKMEIEAGDYIFVCLCLMDLNQCYGY